MYWILGIGFVVGLAAHVGGFLLKNSVTTEPLLLVADLQATRRGGTTERRQRRSGQDERSAG